MAVHFAPPRESVQRSTRQSAKTTPLQTMPPSPTQRLVHTRADPAQRGRPDATRASGFAQLADKSAPHTTAPSRSELRAARRGARASLADSIALVVRRAARFDRFALRSAKVRRQAWS